jgi:hypothetical protein
MPRSLIHVLLSLLLLVSQQLSLGHGYTHWTEVSSTFSADSSDSIASQAVPDDDDTTRVPKPVLHDLCGQCAAGAQLAFALPSQPRSFLPAELAYAAPTAPQTPGICLLADCPFQSRAPPRAG